MLLPVFPRPVKRSHGVRHVLHAFIADLGQPEFDRFRFGTGNGLDKTEKRFRIGDIGKVLLPVSSLQFQSVTNCHRLTSLIYSVVHLACPSTFAQSDSRQVG